MSDQLFSCPGICSDNVKVWLMASITPIALSACCTSCPLGGRALLPHDHINIDASDLGVCGVWHTPKLYFAVQRIQEELDRIEISKARVDTYIRYRQLLGAYISVDL
jgi:hypothetical protein